MLFTTLLLVTLGQDNYYQQQYDNQQYRNQQYRYEAQQQSQRDMFEGQRRLLALQHKAQLDAVKAQATARANGKSKGAIDTGTAQTAGRASGKTKPPLECRAMSLGQLEPLGGRFNERTHVLTVFLEDPDGALVTFKAVFDGAARTRVTAARLALESVSGMHLVSVAWKHGETGHFGVGSARRFKALLTDVTLHTATRVFEASPTPSDCLLIAQVAIDVPWYD